jgi:hypothetical protein
MTVQDCLSFPTGIVTGSFCIQDTDSSLLLYYTFCSYCPEKGMNCFSNRFLFNFIRPNCKVHKTMTVQGCLSFPTGIGTVSFVYRYRVSLL